MIHLILFLLCFGGNIPEPEVKVCVGDKCHGDRIPSDYFDKNYVLSPEKDGYEIESFVISYPFGKGSMYDKKFMGNHFQEVASSIKQACYSGSRVYFDDIILRPSSGKGEKLKTYAIFTIE